MASGASPAEHGSHDLLPAAVATELAPHGMQSASLVAADWGWCLPAAHSVHAAPPCADLKVPGAHVWQLGGAPV